MFELGTKIQSQVQSEMEKGQREYFLRQQLKAIQEELGEGDPEQAELEELRERLDALDAPRGRAEGGRRASSARLEKLPPAAAEYGVIRTYLDWILTLPWGTLTEDNLDLDRARRDPRRGPLRPRQGQGADHRVPRRREAEERRLGPDPLLRRAARASARPRSASRSRATLGRKFVRISVGGVRDEAEIRGHRRTYIGAMPGTIIRALRDAESKNPVFLIDEIDKMGADFRGDPASAMLEVLDPEQNATFRDHYLDLPFDLSKVLFICTANTLDTIPGPLLDRMDVIQLSGYTEDEKLGIAKRYLVPKQLEAHGLKREAGRRSGDGAAPGHPRVHARGGRARTSSGGSPTSAARRRAQVAAGQGRAAAHRRARVREWLGPRRFAGEVAQAHVRPGRRDRPRVHRRRRRRPLHRGDRVPGQGQADDHRPARRGDAGVGAGGALVGALATPASSALAADWFAEHDVHIHVPAGAVPKDGPSAGRDDGDRDRLARPRRAGRRGRRHDRRDHPHRPGAADRRRPREGARRRSAPA